LNSVPVPTDEEVLWLGYDTTYALPTSGLTGTGKILHTAWPDSQVAIDVQWGKHGSLPGMYAKVTFSDHAPSTFSTR